VGPGCLAAVAVAHRRQDRQEGAGPHRRGRGDPRRGGLSARPPDVVLDRVHPAEHTADLLKKIPDRTWTPAYDAEGKARDGAWVGELTGLLDLTGNDWPPDMRVIVGKERPHPGAQLRITDVEGHRITAFATNTAILATPPFSEITTTGLSAPAWWPW
jgi:hypothetical protein